MIVCLCVLFHKEIKVSEMKKMFLLIAALVVSFPALVVADTYVNGYTRKDGTYVKPHYRSKSDGNVYNNWSTKGNVNPYTGKAGTRNPTNYGSSNSGKSNYGSYNYGTKPSYGR